MTERIIIPRGRGFLLLDAHPGGCAADVASMRAELPSAPARGGAGPVALVIGSSAGYGLAATVAGLAGHGINGAGVCLERPPTERRTGTAGWYRTIATAAIAAQAGADFSFVNADAFADTTKDTVLDLIGRRFGGLDYLIYSVAAPRRTDSRTGATYHSVIKPLGAGLRTKTLSLDRADGARRAGRAGGAGGADGLDGSAARLREISLEPATAAETAETVQVMGGEDWARWLDAVLARGLAKPGFGTVALTYIGSGLTAAIYRDGTIGAAKKHLEGTAAALDTRLRRAGGRAFTSVNGAAVTQSSTAIPGIGLYLAILRSVLGERMRTPAQQSASLWDQLTGAVPADLDEQGRIRLDRWELAGDVQQEVASRWAACESGSLAGLAEADWFADQVLRLYGFRVPGVDYTKPAEPDLPWPDLPGEAAAG
jgi:enoyl-[acyl-carrier protein] reductase / trans-2-enoyl-CoA reductase (NAD+)